MNCASEEERAFWVRFGQTVATHRKAQGLKQWELAMDLGISRAQLANIERAHQRTNAWQIKRMTQALGVPPWAFFYSGKPKPEPTGRSK